MTQIWRTFYLKAGTRRTRKMHLDLPSYFGATRSHSAWELEKHVDLGRAALCGSFSDHTYVHLIRDITTEKTVIAQEAYKRYMAKHRNKVGEIRTNNGRFADKVFRDFCKEANIKLTFCAVGDHHQNDVVERRIQEISLTS